MVLSAQSNELEQDFSAKYPDFPQKARFSANHGNTLENSKVHPIRRLVRWTETYTRNVPIFFTTRRFGGVGAPKGRKKVPYHIFPQIKRKLCFWRKITSRVLRKNMVGSVTLLAWRQPL